MSNNFNIICIGLYSVGIFVMGIL